MKYRKPVSVVLIAAFAMMTTNCVTTRSVASARLKPAEKDYRIVRIVKKTGERIDVDRSNPAYIAGDGIHIGGRLKVPAAGTTVMKRGGGYAITPLNGLSYDTDAFESSGRYYVFKTKADIVIPISEVSEVAVIKKNTGMTILAVVGGIAVAGGVLLAISFSSWKNSNWLHWD
jgi:hypothetical protein